LAVQDIAEEGSILNLKYHFIALVCAGFTVGCGNQDEEEKSLAWKGADAHLVVRGHLNGEDIDVALTGADAMNSERLWCAREYQAPEDANGEPDASRAKLYEITLNGIVTIHGEERLLQLELKPHDFQSDPVPAVVHVVPRVDDHAPASNELWAEFEWLTPDGETDLLETSAHAGAFRLELYTGQPGSDGITIPAGMGAFGGTLSAKWSEQEQLQMSVSAPCIETELELE
jgi:hypothetical protein